MNEIPSQDLAVRIRFAELLIKHWCNPVRVRVRMAPDLLTFELECLGMREARSVTLDGQTSQLLARINQSLGLGHSTGALQEAYNYDPPLAEVEFAENVRKNLKINFDEALKSVDVLVGPFYSAEDMAKSDLGNLDINNVNETRIGAAIYLPALEMRGELYGTSAPRSSSDPRLLPLTCVFLPYELKDMYKRATSEAYGLET